MVGERTRARHEVGEALQQGGGGYARLNGERDVEGSGKRAGAAMGTMGGVNRLLSPQAGLFSKDVHKC